MDTSSLIVLCLMCGLTLETEAQKNGFRGGSKSYEIHVEASTMGTNLHYKLPESKVKAASKQDWQVDNDNAEMLAMNSPVLATVNVKHPKFSMKGQWPGYKTSFKLPKDVSVASKRTDFSKFNQGRHEKIKKESDQRDTDFSGSAQYPRHQTKTDGQPAGSEVLLSKLAGRLLKQRKAEGKKPWKPRQEDGANMAKITKLLLPIAGLKNVDLNNPHVSDAMKGVIKHARKVVDEAKTVLNDAANFVTKVRKLVKVTKNHSKMHIEITKASPVAKETSPTRQTDSIHTSKNLSPLSQEQIKMNSARLKVAEKGKGNDSQSRQRSLQRKLDNLKAKHSGSNGNEAKLTTDTSGKGVDKRTHLDSPETNKTRNKRNSRAHHRGLGETLESILSTINGLNGLLKYRH